MTTPLRPPLDSTHTPISQFYRHLRNLDGCFTDSVQEHARLYIGSADPMQDFRHLFDLKDTWIKSVLSVVVPRWEGWEELARLQADNLVVQTTLTMQQNPVHFLCLPELDDNLRYLPKPFVFASLPNHEMSSLFLVYPKDGSYYSSFVNCLPTLDLAFTMWVHEHKPEARWTALEHAKNDWKAKITYVVAAKWDGMAPDGRSQTVSLIEKTIQHLQNNTFRLTVSTKQHADLHSLANSHTRMTDRRALRYGFGSSAGWARARRF
ncbi:hypothetical protein JCM11641_006355 [Rhodosporidiobolus odoratus]